METIKSYTDLEQSRKLADMLPLESADMYYDGFGRLPQGYAYPLIYSNSFEYDKPCWSLAALINILPEKYTELIKEGNMYMIIIKDSYMTCLFDNPVDACVAMIEKLHKLKML